MVMDDMFGQLSVVGLSDLPLPDEIDPVFNSILDTTVGLGLDPKDMDLDELNFDFEEMKDFGPWIETSELVNTDIKMEDSYMMSSDRLSFEDLEIKEAVRYDCMWSSYNQFGSKKVKPEDSCLTLPSSFYDSLLQNIETPETSEVDSSSIKSEMDTDDEIDVTCDSKTNLPKEEIEAEKVKEETTHHSTIDNASFLSLDHCYNISSTHLDNEKYLGQKGPLTPPVSSDEEEPSPTTFTFNLNSRNKLHNSTIKYKQNLNKVQSILKKPNHRVLKEAKFSFKVNLKADKSRSLLKQKVKIIKAPFKSTHISSTPSDSLLKKHIFEQQQKIRTSQSAVRKRKERSLKMQETEAREVHNQMERQRRNELKVAFDDLKVCLPEISASDKASKQQILDKAVETCKIIRSTESSLAQRKLLLSKNNSLLKEKLKLLKADLKRKNDFNLGIDEW